jgi:hypothetical protein
MAYKKGIISARNKQYWLNRGYSIEDAIKMAKSRMPGSFEYYTIFKGLSDDAANTMVKEWGKIKAITLESMIKRYGEIEGAKRWDQYRKRQADSNTFEYKNKKHGWDKTKFDEFNLSRAVTLQNLIKKHGEENGTAKWKEYCDRQAYAGCKLEYFVEKYGDVEGTKKYKDLVFSKSHSYESYLHRYDNDETLAMAAYLKCKQTHRSPYSNIANELFTTLFKKLTGVGITKIFFSGNIREWYIFDNNLKRIFFLDFFAKDIGKVIEFNGDYWHANPKKYNANDVIKFPDNVVKKASEIWEVDEYKISMLKKHPLIKDVLIIWESDYRNDKKLVLDLCSNFIMQ